MSTRFGKALEYGNRPRGLILAAGLGLALLAGCDLPGKPNPADQFQYPSAELGFEPLYEQNCAGCHGASGKLGPAPPLNDPLFLAIVPDQELVRVISEGRPGTPMPAFVKEKGGTLTQGQVNALAAGLKKHWGPNVPPSRTLPPYFAPPGLGGEKTEGGAGLLVFARACAGCHGEHGRGTEKAGAINDPAFLALISDQALRRLIITGRPDLGMPDYASAVGRPAGFQPLTSREIEDLVILLAAWRQRDRSVTR